MPALSIADVQSKLEHKFDLRPRNSKDVYFELWVDGKKLVFTKTSHKGSSKGEIGANRQSEMARQLGMPSGHWFYGAISCTKTKREYYEYLARNNPEDAEAIRALLDAS